MALDVLRVGGHVLIPFVSHAVGAAGRSAFSVRCNRRVLRLAAGVHFAVVIRLVIRARRWSAVVRVSDESVQIESDRNDAC